MKRFLQGHATHPDPHLALALAAAQVEAQRGQPGCADAPTLGWLYLTEAYAPHTDRLLDELRQRWPGVRWVGASGVGIAASGVEYVDEPALVLLLAEIPRDRFRVFSGARPLGEFDTQVANVHADPTTGDLAELIREMSRRTRSGYLFGGLASARTQAVHIAEEALTGGLSGVAFGRGVRIVSRVTQGCTPVGRLREVTAAERNVVTTLDDQPALDCLLRDLKLEGAEPRQALPTLRQVLVGLSDAAAIDPALDPGRDAAAATAGVGAASGRPGVAPGGSGSSPAAGSSGSSAGDSASHSPGDPRGDSASHAASDPRGGSTGRTTGDSRSGSTDDDLASGIAATSRRGAFGTEVRVRHLIGLDPGRRGIAIADEALPGMRLAFCVRNAEAARRDLVRVCAEVREAIEPDDLPLVTALALRDGLPNAIAAEGGHPPSPAAGTIAGAIYVSCSGRGGAHFGGPSAELAIVRHALGDVPLAGFFAAGEIARENLYGYTGVLTVFPA